MDHPDVAPDIGRHPLQTSNILPQNPQHQSHIRPKAAEPLRSSSNITVPRSRRPSRSRGSTASIHSNTTQSQYHPDHYVPTTYPSYMQPDNGTNQQMYPSNPEEMIIRFGAQLANTSSHHGTALDPIVIDPNLQAYAAAAEALVFETNFAYQGPDLQLHGLPIHGPSAELPPNGVTGDVHPDHSHYPPLYDGVENQIPDHLMPDNDVSESGPRKRRSSTTTLANDNELRRLLRQYDGYSLRQMAAEVQKHDGAGGKAEKVKQVFAMIWLRENCQKSTKSVRRDRVYCSYAEQCGTERVSVLNPASFGKLVRIIFPNVQTRRLGVRGESKYHYVDMSLREQDRRPAVDILGNNAGATSVAQQNVSNGNINGAQDSASQPQATATNPPHSNSTTSSEPNIQGNITTNTSPNLVTMSSEDNSLVETHQVIDNLLHFNHPNEPVPVESALFKLPSIHGYLPSHADSANAEALEALYRSHCISVIDSFRFCKEKNFLRHFSSFQGTLTVPVHKVLTLPEVAPWIRECDWLMYKKMIAFVAPLTTQVVPEPVLNAFKSISKGLVTYVQKSMKSHPDHVAEARLSPARVFCHLLKRMLDVNQSAIAASAWLSHADNRTRMWQDFVSYIDPVEIAAKAKIPSCSLAGVVSLMKHQIKALVAPVEDNDESPDDVQLYDEQLGFQKFSYSSSDEGKYSQFPDRWIAFILNLPLLFPNHRPQCIIDKADAVWTLLLHGLTLGGAQSFSAWWMTKVFFLEMMWWQAERAGFMSSTSQALLELSFVQGVSYATAPAPAPAPSAQRSHTAQPGTGSANSASNSSAQGGGEGSAQLTNISPIAHANETPSSMSPAASSGNEESSITVENANGNANVNPSISPSGGANLNSNHDDSAIDLDDDPALVTESKYGDITASDPADEEGQVVVV
ncbi:hypothetical protein ACO22_05694 [Paracoccidioides brasiliensis]|uniref:RFX-type winged-helix domain-containing protein n=1 Tax=Paracoccidioides brasiliensis TaxID=121759 RepID=A0A1D2J9P2_PARBR|nr:hypothetical protein ACO22_05694 [Paracoccidioides brasiliensis]